MPEAVLTDPHRSIQAVHDRCIAMAECMQTRTSYPETRKDRVQDLIHNIPIVIRVSFAGAEQQLLGVIFPVGEQVGFQMFAKLR